MATKKRLAVPRGTTKAAVLAKERELRAKRSGRVAVSAGAAKAAEEENARMATVRAASLTGELASERAMRETAEITVAVNGRLTLSAEAVKEVKALRQAKKTLEADLEALAAKLGAKEAAIIAALDAGLPVEPGCPLVAVKEDPAQIRPKWKDEALTLADKLGLNRGVYEAEVKARTEAELPPEKRTVKKLVINGDVKAR